jgi:uncharacterized protein YyaL (SSP411 family)
MANRLASEASLYLRQHADNPVHWQPWDETALAQARRERKPILLSIGYSACHWCHVMAHESFEDAATASVMNALYVNIKVDREERPDLDKIYQLAHQALSRRGGGWPLTVFLAPDDLLPFYAGTYFPPQPRHGLPAFVEVLQGVRQWFDTHPSELAQQNAALGEFLADHGRGTGRVETLDEAPLRLALERIRAGFDAQHGGHRGAPKFPPATELELLQRFADGDEDAAAMAEHTLRKMAERGLQDHLLGGFFRYCVDAHWGIPHFEKMLYDNAALLGCYAEAALEGDVEFVAAAEGIVRWLQRDMRLASGGLASAMDADSDGEEGAYYLWTPSQVSEALRGDPQRDAFVAAYGLDDRPNFEGQAWHLLRERPLEEVGDFAGARAALLRIRDERTPPARDDKQLTAWNAMAIRALCRAALRLDQPQWLALADEVLDALRIQAWRDGRLLAVAGNTRLRGYLDDHAFLLDALLEGLQARWEEAGLTWAVQLAETLLADFEDAAHGGFFFTPHAHEALPQRPKPWFDEATPSGNGVAARGLLRLGWLLGEPRYLDAAERTLRAGLAEVRDAPHGACALLGALHEWLQPAPVIVLRATAAEAAAWQGALAAARDDGALAFVLAPEATALREKAHAPGGRAYVCRGMQCSAPATAAAELAGLLAR